jgi:hypothetical protein
LRKNDPWAVIGMSIVAFNECDLREMYPIVRILDNTNTMCKTIVDIAYPKNMPTRVGRKRCFRRSPDGAVWMMILYEISANAKIAGKMIVGGDWNVHRRNRRLRPTRNASIRLYFG